MVEILSLTKSFFLKTSILTDECLVKLHYVKYWQPQIFIFVSSGKMQFLFSDSLLKINTILVLKNKRGNTFVSLAVGNISSKI